VNEFLYGHFNKGETSHEQNCKSFSERIPIWPLQLALFFFLVSCEKFQWTNSYMATSTLRPLSRIQLQKVSVNEFLYGHFNLDGAIFLGNMTLFQWTNSYMATSTNWCRLQRRIKKFQWTNSYMATSTHPTQRWQLFSCFSERIPIWPLQHKIR